VEKTGSGANEDETWFLKNEPLCVASSVVVGGNSGLRAVMEQVHQVATLNTIVLLEGETGSGKEIIANAIHQASPRKAAPYLKVNCGAIPENLIDDELFGHDRGAFTGANCTRKGWFERADGGTLFLDEIGELPLTQQVRLLRVLQTKVIHRVGGGQPIPVNVRIIAATNRDLRQMVAENKFREDLWFRLNVFCINIPPLRRRKEDIPALVRYFVKRKSLELGIPVPPAIAPGAFDYLNSRYWPGNIRELENVVERELIRHRSGALMFHAQPQATAREELPVPGQRGEQEGGEHGGGEQLMPLNEAVRRHIRRALKITKGKVHGPGGAAELLHVNANTLTSKMRKLGLAHGRLKSDRDSMCRYYCPAENTDRP